MTRKTSTPAENILAFATWLTTLADLVTRSLGHVQTAPDRRRQRVQDEEKAALQLEALQLKNELTARKVEHEEIKAQVTANREILTGHDIDAKVLKLLRDEFNLVSSGILPANKAQHYHRPPMSDKPENL